MREDGCLQEAPPSAKLVYLVLDRHGSLTQAALAERTRLPPRTVRSALRRLDRLGVIDKRMNWQDTRRRRYALVTDE